MSYNESSENILMDENGLHLKKPHFKTAIFKSFLNYLQSNYPNIDIAKIVAKTGLDLAYFLDEKNWVSVEVERKFIEACYEATNDPHLSFKVGQTALHKENIGALTHLFVRHIVPINEFFDRLPRMTSMVNRVMLVKIERENKNKVNVEYSIDRRQVTEAEYLKLVQSFPSMMENIRGYFFAVSEVKRIDSPRIVFETKNDQEGLLVGVFTVTHVTQKDFFTLKNMLMALFIGPLLVPIYIFGLHGSIESLKYVMFGLPLLLLIGLSIRHRNLQLVSIETEKSLTTLDAQYTELHSAKVIMAEQLNESRLINDVSAAFLGVENEEALLSSACQNLISYIGFDRVVVLMYDSKKDCLTFSVSAGKGADTLGKLFDGFSINLNRNDVSQNALSSVFKTGKPILVSDVKKYLKELTEEKSKQVLLQSGSSSFACTPIRTSTSKIGIMIADVVNSNVVLNENKLRLLSVVANQMAIFLEKQRAKQSLVEAYESEVRLAEAYSRFVPMETLKLLDYNSVLDVHIGDGVEREMTVMFSDIRKFTTLCETMTPSEVLKFLNSYYGRLSPIIKAHHGIIDKFIGDGLMAIFNDFQDAINASIAMQRELIRYNLERRAGGRRLLEAGIGIAKGQIIFGPLGADKRLQLTALSDSVNLASRLDSLCSDKGAKIMVSGSQLHEIPQYEFIKVKKYEGESVKGKSKNIDVIELIDTEQIRLVENEYKKPEQIAYLEESNKILQERIKSANVISELINKKSA